MTSIMAAISWLLIVMAHLLSIPLAYLMDIFPPLRTGFDTAIMTIVEILKTFY